MNAVDPAPSPSIASSDVGFRDAQALERIARLLAWSVGAVVVVLLLRELADVLLLVFAAILIAVVLRGAAEHLGRLVRISTGWALLAIVLGLAVLVGVTTWWRGPVLAEELGELGGRLDIHIRTLWQAMHATAWGSTVADHARDYLDNMRQHFAGIAAGVATSTLGSLGSIVVLAATALYLAASPGTYVRGTILLLPRPWRARGNVVMHELGSTLCWWFVGQGVDMIMVGVLSAIGLLVLGVPLVLTLGVIAALFNFVPYIGALAGAVPAIVVALGQGPRQAIYVAVLYLAVQSLEGNVIAPLIQRRTVHLAPVLTILSQTVLGTLFGFMGLILATPLTAAGIVLVRMVYVEDVLGNRQGGEEAPPG